MPQSKPIPMDSNILDSRSRTYMIGHQMMNKQQLQEALAAAEQDPDLRGSLRVKVIGRYKTRIAGEKF